MRGMTRLFEGLSQDVRRERLIGEALCDLQGLLAEAERAGQGSKPAARLARAALQAIDWR
jgi:hypothetical protein